MTAFSNIFPRMVNWFWRKKPAESEQALEQAPLTKDAEAGPSPLPPPVSAEPAIPDTPYVAPDVAPVVAPDAPPTDASPAEPARSDDEFANAAPAATPGKTGWRERLKGSGFARSLGGLFSRNPKLDEELLEEIETALLTADVGIKATTVLVDDLRTRMNRREFADAHALLAALRADLVAMLAPVAKPLQIDRGIKPFVIVTIGVNGVGKTTTIGKLARKFRDEGHSLMLAAGDTFRAAAVAQLQAWGEKNGVHVVGQGQNADAAAVAFDAYSAAKSRGSDILIADTAGRLHTQGGLMDELGKIVRVLGKHGEGIPHEILMVIDGTTGQNAISQLRAFSAKVPVSGLVVTKLDGTAKGGVLFALAQEFAIPIRYA
ncbi:MAG: signal recognition particle-docking protein FtsY, partial [Pseudomonadota bacterium]|nr:signal recognition particle-docking protein FtsY [Pseudomonadota bacterium]